MVIFPKLKSVGNTCGHFHNINIWSYLVTLGHIRSNLGLVHDHKSNGQNLQPYYGENYGHKTCRGISVTELHQKNITSQYVTRWTWVNYTWQCDQMDLGWPYMARCEQMDFGWPYMAICDEMWTYEYGVTKSDHISPDGLGVTTHNLGN